MRCPACPGNHACVAPDGPTHSRYLLLGEAPDEDKRGIPFIGKTGKEVNEHYLPMVGWQRFRVRVTNAIRCFPDRPEGKLNKNKPADIELLKSCAEHHLYPELKCNNYSLIVAMGAFACYAIDSNIDLDLHHGIPLHTKWGIVFPMFHPAGGLHEPKKMLQIRTDWYRLGQYLKGKLYQPEDQYAGVEDYREITVPGELGEALEGAEDLPHGGDTEVTYRRDPYCLTFSIRAGTGYLVRASRPDLLQAYQTYLDRWRGPILFHNWPFDYQVTKAMGLRFPRRKIVDTMSKVFHLGNLPQGLKALAYRELGMEMQDFDDLVTPYSRPLVLDYFRNARELEWPKPEPFLERSKEGKWEMHQPQSMKTKLKRFFTDLSKNEGKDPFRMWDDNWYDQHELIETQCGPYPGKCITHTPFEKILFYACRDADALVRLWPVIKLMESRVRKRPQERWREEASNDIGTARYLLAS